MAVLIGRDVTVMTVGGQALLAVYQECSVTLETNMVDVSAAADAWRSYVEGSKQWRMALRLRKSSSAKFAGMLVSGGTCQVSFTEASGGKAYTGVGLIQQVVTDGGALDTAQLESVNIQGSGGFVVT